MNGNELSKLKTARAKAQAEVDRRKADVAYAERALQDSRDYLATIEKQLKQASSEVTVSDHAVLRYVERVMGVDTEAIRQKILQGDTADKVRLLGNGKFPIGDGVKAVVKNNVVVTLLEV